MKLETIKALQDLGFSEYEAKAYLALLEKSPLSGYAAALTSGVPRSKIYGVLSGLAERGEVIMSHGTPDLYSPLPPEELIARRRRKAEATLETAEDALEQFSYSSGNRENIWNITGRDDIIKRVEEAIRHAEGCILLEIWKEDAEEIRAALEEAARHGIEVLVVSYGDLELGGVRVYPHDLPEEITEEWGGRWVVLSVDDREIVAGIISLGEDSRAAWTTHPGLVMPMTEMIKHDIYLMEILNKHRDVLEGTFGPQLVDLRNRFRFSPRGTGVATRFRLVKP